MRHGGRVAAQRGDLSTMAWLVRKVAILSTVAAVLLLGSAAWLVVHFVQAVTR